MDGEVFLLPKKRSRLSSALFVCLCLLTAACLVGVGVLQIQKNHRRHIEETGMPVAAVYQYDYPEAVCCLGGEDKSVATSGCGAACLSMAIRYLTGDEVQTPETLFRAAYDRGDYFGDGLSHAALDRLGEDYGVEGEWIGRDAAAIRRALETGRPVIAHMGPGTFTQQGHYILLRGLDEDGKVVLNDPNSEKHTYHTYDLSLFLEEAKGDTPFKICSRAAS